MYLLLGNELPVKLEVLLCQTHGNRPGREFGETHNTIPSLPVGNPLFAARKDEYLGMSVLFSGMFHSSLAGCAYAYIIRSPYHS